MPLLERPQLIALNKIDVPEGRELAEFVRPDLEARGYRVFEISAVSREGLRELSFALGELVAGRPRRRGGRSRVAAAHRHPPEGRRRRRIRRSRVEGGTYGNIYRVLGAKPERWVQQTDFTNDEAVGFLADRLAKLGVEDELFKAGAVAGSTVVIGAGDGVVFDWEPTLTSAAELMTAPRGTDARLDDEPPPTTQASAARSTSSAWMPRPPRAPSSMPSARPASGHDDEGFADHGRRGRPIAE